MITNLTPEAPMPVATCFDDTCSQCGCITHVPVYVPRSADDECPAPLCMRCSGRTGTDPKGTPVTLSEIIRAAEQAETAAEQLSEAPERLQDGMSKAEERAQTIAELFASAHLLRHAAAAEIVHQQAPWHLEQYKAETDCVTCRELERCPSDHCTCADCITHAAARVSFERGRPNYFVLREPYADLDEALALELARRQA